MPTDFWLGLTAIGTLALAATTFFLGWQSRGAVQLGREQLRALLRRDEPMLLWDQGEIRRHYIWQGEQGPGTPCRMRVRCRATNYGGPATMGAVGVRGDGEIDVETPQRLLPPGGSSFFIDVGFGGLVGDEPFNVHAVLTFEYTAVASGEQRTAVVLVSGISRWFGFDDPSAWVIPLDTEEAKSDEGIARLRARHREAYEQAAQAGDAH